MFNRPQLNNDLEGLSFPRPSADVESLLERFSISIPAPSSVSLVLPPGVSRLDFLELVHKEFQKAHQLPLITEEELRNWTMAQSIEDTYASPLHIGVEIQRPSNSPQKREKHEAALLQQGREMASQEDTAVAFAAYWLKTRSDLFEDLGVQTSGRGLQLNDDGLVEVEYFKTIAVAVSQARSLTSNL
jgi:hypothetical protein